MQYKKTGILSQANTGLKIIKVIGKKHRKDIVLALCKCGTVKEYYFSNIKNGLTKSCGCLRSSRMAAIGKTKPATSHNMSRTEFYYVYHSILSRCNNTNNRSYKNYGGRGIKCFWGSFLEFQKEKHVL